MTEKTLIIYNCSEIETIEKTNGKKKSSYKEEDIADDIKQFLIEHIHIK